MRTMCFFSFAILVFLGLQLASCLNELSDFLLHFPGRSIVLPGNVYPVEFGSVRPPLLGLVDSHLPICLRIV